MILLNNKEINDFIVNSVLYDDNSGLTTEHIQEAMRTVSVENGFIVNYILDHRTLLALCEELSFVSGAGAYEKDNTGYMMKNREFSDTTVINIWCT